MPRNSATFTSKVIGFLCVNHRFVFGNNKVDIKRRKVFVIIVVFDKFCHETV